MRVGRRIDHMFLSPWIAAIVGMAFGLARRTNIWMHIWFCGFPNSILWQGEKKGNASPRAVTSSGVAWDRGIEWQGTWWNQICGASWNGAQGFTPKLPKPGERQPRLWPQSSSKGLRDWIKLVLAYKDGMMVKLGDVNAMQVGLWWHTT